MDFSKSFFLIFVLISMSQTNILQKFERIPQIVLFDLEFTLFPRLVDSYMVPPFRYNNVTGSVVDVNRVVVKPYPEVQKVFKYLTRHRIPFGACTSTLAVEEIKEIIKLFKWDKLFKIVEVYPMIDAIHMKELSKRTNISLSDMLLFDDESHVHRLMQGINVVSIPVTNGITLKLIKEGLQKFSNTRPADSRMHTGQVKFVICDFETSPMPKGNCLLLTGAMVNSISKYSPVRLQGRPYFISRGGKAVKYHSTLHGPAMNFVSRIFNLKNKAKALTTIKQQFSEAMCFSNQGNKSTLTISRIKKYLCDDGKKPVVVFWNGNSDKYIFRKLQIEGVLRYLDISTVKRKGTNHFELLVKDMNRGNLVIFSMNIGDVYKPHGGMLNLQECHSAMCSDPHDDVTFCHDPLTDVIYTRCIFWHILKEFKPLQLYAYCNLKPDRNRKRKR